MSCKLGDKCDNVFACNILRPNVELLGCNFYKPKKPMTNEEWLRSLNTEQLAEYLADKFNEVVDFVLHEVDENAEDVEPDDYWYRQDVIVEWLKQPHSEVGK